MVRYFSSEREADTAIRSAIAAGKCRTGHSSVWFLGARAVYTAHVRDGCASWCLR